MKEFFANSKNGVGVYWDNENSHAVTHFAHHPKLRAAAEKFISEIEIKNAFNRVEGDTGEIIGMSSLVETVNGDKIVYALRPLRKTYSRFVKNKKPVPTSWVTIDIRQKDDEYFLYTAFVGRLTPSFPGGDYLPEQSKEFWSKHALVWGSQEIVPGTETTICPWWL